MKSKNYYLYQLERFTELQKCCTDIQILKKINRAVSIYKQMVDNYDSIVISDFEECHCTLCVMQE